MDIYLLYVFFQYTTSGGCIIVISVLLDVSIECSICACFIPVAKRKWIAKTHASVNMF